MPDEVQRVLLHPILAPLPCCPPARPGRHFGSAEASGVSAALHFRHTAGSGKEARGAMYQVSIGCLRSDVADQDEEGQACWPVLARL